MSLNNINTNLKADRGFTIVELLIVVVVIGILAAITVVAFNGVTNRANAASAQSAATSVAKKAEAYNAENGRYPVTSAELTSAATTSAANLPASTATFVTTAITAAPDPVNTVRFLKCSTTAVNPANQAAITTSNITGVRIQYWKHDATPAAAQTVDAGVTQVCPTS